MKWKHLRLGCAACTRSRTLPSPEIIELLDARGITIPRAATEEGFAHVSWPGRLDVRRLADGREVLLDAAHNPDGARALAAYIRTSPFSGAPLVFAALRDKDVDGILSPSRPTPARCS